MERVIKEYVPCERCRGTGLVNNGIPYGKDGHRRWECEVCQGYGKTLVSTRKEVIKDGEKPERYGY